MPSPGNSPWILWVLITTVVVLAIFAWLPADNEWTTISYSALQIQASEGNVEEVTLRGARVRGIFVEPVHVHERRIVEPRQELPNGVSPDDIREISQFESTVPEGRQDNFVGLLERHGVEIYVEESGEGFGFPFFLLIGLPILFFLALLFLMSRAWAGARGAQDFFSFSKSRARLYDASRPRITFDDVAGEDQAKSELMQVVDFLKNPQKFHEIGARLPRGVLLAGPPGTGKTLLARAVAGEAGVPFYNVSASEFVEMFVGVGAGRVRDLFQKAKESAPSIIFVDELDAVGRQRFAGVGSGNDEREQTLNQILVEMDGFEPHDEVIVMAATNRPDVLDPALLRPGRFDRQVTLGLPDRRARKAILKIHLKNVPVGNDVDISWLAQSTPGFSGADLANLVNEAALIAARKDKKVVEQLEFNEALDRIILGTERPLVMSEHEKRVIAYHEAGHAIVAHYTPGADPLRMISIIPRGQALGVTMQAPSEDRFNHTRRYLIGRLAILMGGRAAEQLVFNEITTGAQNDLKEATQLARRMVGLWGMSDRIGPFYLGLGEEHIFLGREMAQERSLSDELLARAEEAAQALVTEAMQVATETLRKHKTEMEMLVERLLSEESLSREQIDELLNAVKPAGEDSRQPETVI